MKEGVISISNVVVPCEAPFLVGSIINSVGVCVCVCYLNPSFFRQPFNGTGNCVVVVLFLPFILYPCL